MSLEPAQSGVVRDSWLSHETLRALQIPLLTKQIEPPMNIEDCIVEALERVVHFARTTGETVDRYDVMCLISYVIETAQSQSHGRNPLSDETYGHRIQDEAYENYLRQLVNMPEYFMGQILVQNQSGQNADAQLERLATTTIERGITQKQAERIADMQIKTWKRKIAGQFPDPQNKARQRLEQWLEYLNKQFAIYYNRLADPATCFQHLQKVSMSALEAWYGNPHRAIQDIHRAETRLHAFLHSNYYHLLNQIFNESQWENPDIYAQYISRQQKTENKIRYIVSYCFKMLIQHMNQNAHQNKN